MTDKTLLLQLREAARVERDKLIQFNLKLIADELDRDIAAFAKNPTAAALTAVNGKWAQAMRTLSFAGQRNTPGGNGAGLKEGALLTRVA
jgi:hypothetical protein